MTGAVGPGEPREGGDDDPWRVVDAMHLEGGYPGSERSVACLYKGMSCLFLRAYGCIQLFSTQWGPGGATPETKTITQWNLILQLKWGIEAPQPPLCLHP